MKRVKRRTIYVLAVGVLLSLLSLFMNKKSIYVRENELMRGSYGTQKTPYKVKLDAKNLAKNMEFNVSVSSRRYTKDEADKKFREKLDELKVGILNQNDDYEHISSKLNFKSDLGDGIKANYSFEPKRDVGLSSASEIIKKSTESNASDFKYFVKYQGLIDGNGNVKNEDFKSSEACTGFLEIELSTDIDSQDSPYRSDKILLPVKVISKKLSTIDSFKATFKKEVEKNDADSITRDTILLPDIINDFKVTYKENINLSPLLMILFSVIVVILLNAKDAEKIKEEEKKKKRSLELDFSQIISKLLLYVSSGMTIRNSMIRLAEQYQVRNDDINRKAYEELIVVRNKLLSGYNEIKAYEDMARNIGMRSYTRFLNIIIQSIMNGNKELKNILNMEVQDALYERKQHAKKLGEEAATKLVLPLMMMLAVIMVVIMVPAFMGM